MQSFPDEVQFLSSREDQGMRVSQPTCYPSVSSAVRDLVSPPNTPNCVVATDNNTCIHARNDHQHILRAVRPQRQYRVVRLFLPRIADMIANEPRSAAGRITLQEFLPHSATTPMALRNHRVAIKPAHRVQPRVTRTSAHPVHTTGWKAAPVLVNPTDPSLAPCRSGVTGDSINHQRRPAAVHRTVTLCRRGRQHGASTSSWPRWFVRPARLH